MTMEPPLSLTPHMKAAVEEMEQRILEHYPEATFDIGEGEDPEGIHLIATVDLEDLGEVVDLSIDRLVDLQVDEQLPLYVIPVRPIERSLEMRQRELERYPWKHRAHPPGNITG